VRPREHEEDSRKVSVAPQPGPQMQSAQRESRSQACLSYVEIWAGPMTCCDQQTVQEATLCGFPLGLGKPPLGAGAMCEKSGSL
jgi:hypothetical protein